ncbi:MAG: hypothetical protein R3B06_32095 [Kofleriaceae bacterium]
MNLTRCSLALFASLLVACVDDTAPDTAATSQSLASCTSSIVVAKTEKMPAPITYGGALPQDVSNRQVWVIAPLTTQATGNWAVYQVDLAGKKVASMVIFPYSKRGTVYAEIGNRNQLLGGVRVPPYGPIGPGGTGWDQVQYLAGLAERIEAAHTP